MIVVAIDYGEKRIGMAVSGPGELALGLPLYIAKGDGGDPARIADRVREQQAEKVVVGLPLNMDGSEGPAAVRVREFARELQGHLDVPLDFMDERLTSDEAERKLRGVDISRKRKREHTNTVAAQLILESYLKGGKS